jgi:hypothetical protein
VSLKLRVANRDTEVVASRSTDSETKRLVSYFEGEAVGRHAFGTFIEAGRKASQLKTDLGALSSCIIALRHNPPHGTAGGARIDCVAIQMSITLDSPWMSIGCSSDLHAEILGSQESAKCPHSNLLLTCLGLSMANTTWHGTALTAAAAVSATVTGTVRVMTATCRVSSGKTVGYPDDCSPAGSTGIASDGNCGPWDSLETLETNCFPCAFQSQ